MKQMIESHKKTLSIVIASALIAVASVTAYTGAATVTIRCMVESADCQDGTQQVETTTTNAQPPTAPVPTPEPQPVDPTPEPQADTPVAKPAAGCYQ